MTITSALAAVISNSAQAKSGIILGGTTHLQIRDIIVSDFEVDLHRLTANLAVLNIRLVAATGIQQDADRFPTERTADPALDDVGIHGSIRAATVYRSTV